MMMMNWLGLGESLHPDTHTHTPKDTYTCSHPLSEAEPCAFCFPVFVPAVTRANHSTAVVSFGVITGWFGLEASQLSQLPIRVEVPFHSFTLPSPVINAFYKSFTCCPLSLTFPSHLVGHLVERRWHIFKHRGFTQKLLSCSRISGALLLINDVHMCVSSSPVYGIPALFCGCKLTPSRAACSVSHTPIQLCVDMRHEIYCTCSESLSRRWYAYTLCITEDLSS